MMHKLLSRIAIIAALLIASFYFLQGKISSPEECGKIAGIWNIETQVCEQTTAQSIYESLAATHPITMLYPETDIQVVLDKTESVDATFYLRGHYQHILQSASTGEDAIYDRGSLYLNMSKMVILNEDANGLVHYAAPFIINTAGSGVFIYVGLFSHDMKTQKGAHLDSALLGNRVRDEKITHINDYLQVDFKEHAQQQSLNEYPVKQVARYFQLTPQLLNFTAVKRMHSSWDKNNDGSNDCESENSCDHTINYSLPRPPL